MSLQMHLGCIVALASCVGAQAPVAETFRDRAGSFVAHFPAGWKIDRESSTFTILSFDPSKRPPQFLVPQDGARIAVARPPAGTGSIAGWLRDERVKPESGDAIATSDVQTIHLGKITVTAVRRHTEAIPEGTLLEYFLDLGDRPLCVALFYRGQRRAEYFEGAALAVVQNLEIANDRK